MRKREGATSLESLTACFTRIREHLTAARSQAMQSVNAALVAA